MRSCVDCGSPTGSPRRRRCVPCKKAFHARSMRVRRAAESGSGWDAISDTPLAEQMVVDYTAPGAAANPPSFTIHRPIKQREEPKADPEVISDGRVLSPAERQPKWDLSAVPNSIRRDRVALENYMRSRRSGGQGLGPDDDAEEADMVAWYDIQARNASYRNDRVVSFHVPPAGSPALGARSQPRVNSLGQSIPRTRYGLR